MVCVPSLTSEPGWADLEASLPGIATECSGIRLTGSATLIRPGQDSHWKANGYKIQTSTPMPIEALLARKSAQGHPGQHGQLSTGQDAEEIGGTGFPISWPCQRGTMREKSGRENMRQGQGKEWPENLRKGTRDSMGN